MKLFRKIAKRIERWLVHNTRKPDASLCDFERIRHEVKACDVLLIEGRSRVSNIIRYLTQSNWTHAALYIGRLYDVENAKLRDLIKSHFKGVEEEQLIIESELGSGTVIRPLKAYNKEHIRICRPGNLGHSDGQEVIGYAISQLGKRYYSRQIFDLMRFFLPYKIIPARIGSSLFKMKAGYAVKTVCSSMIAEAFCFIQYPVLPLVKVTDTENKIKLYHRNPKLCTPKDFDYSPYFQIIKYPFFDCGHYDNNYRLLPWAGDQELKSGESNFYMTQEQLQTLKELSGKKNDTPPPKPSEKKQ